MIRRSVAFLGSINVGGNRLTMAELRAAFESEGFRDVETVVASGNVLFRHSERPSLGLEEKLKLLVRERFDMKSIVAVRSRDEVAAAIADNPFAGSGEDKNVHTIFLEEPLDHTAFDAFARAYEGPERMAPGRREFFVDYALGAGRSRLDPAMRKARVVKGGATARNVRSLARILKKLDEDA